MKKKFITAVVLCLLSGGFAGAFGQAPAKKSATPGVTTDLSSASMGKVIEQMQPVKTESKPPASPVEVIAGFLQLRPDQIAVFGQLLQARQEAAVPVLAEIQIRVKRLEEILKAGSNPAEVGVLVIQIHQLKEQVGQIQLNFLTQFANLLDADQRQRFEAVRLAAQLQPVVPYFQELNLI